MQELLKFYINGAWVDPVELRTHDVIDPSTEAVAARIALGSAADVDRAVKAAQTAFESFGQTSVATRVALLERVIEAYMKRFADIAAAISTEMGAPAALAKTAQAGIGVGHLKTALAGKTQSIKLCLLDQRIVAGLGNIYVCEALWRAGIHPTKPAGKVTGSQLARLVPQIVAVLEASIRDGGSTLRDYARPDGELGYFASSFDVYGREAGACRRDDGGIITRIAQGGRSTWFCPVCQR